MVGNEDGAHHVSAELYQGLNDVGYTLAPNAVSYWVGEAMQGTDFKDLGKTPDTVSKAAEMLARNAAHLAHFLKASQYPGEGEKVSPPKEADEGTPFPNLNETERSALGAPMSEAVDED